MSDSQGFHIHRDIMRERPQPSPQGDYTPRPKIRYVIPTFYKIIATLLLLTTLGFGGLSYYFYNQIKQLKKTPTEVAETEAQQLRAAVAKLMVLPPDEQPTIATVTDPDSLRSQPFFAKAKKGDKVLIFSISHKAILYDPVANKIIEVAPFNDADSVQSAPQPQVKPTATTTKKTLR